MESVYKEETQRTDERPALPDTRHHRGPHPEDKRLFAPAVVPLLRAAAVDLCWLLSRKYAIASALKLVGDRYALAARQRTAVARCACSDEAFQNRRACRVDAEQLSGRDVWIDGYNVLTTVEAALAGGAVVVGRDGCFRDMASMHGSYRKVAETLPAIELVGRVLERCGAPRCVWLLDRPVSNSGRLKQILEQVAARAGWDWTIELAQNPDDELVQTDNVVASADSAVLDRCRSWIDLARLSVAEVPDPWIVDLRPTAAP